MQHCPAMWPGQFSLWTVGCTVSTLVIQARLALVVGLYSILSLSLELKHAINMWAVECVSPWVLWLKSHDFMGLMSQKRVMWQSEISSGKCMTRSVTQINVMHLIHSSHVFNIVFKLCLSFMQATKCALKWWKSVNCILDCFSLLFFYSICQVRLRMWDSTRWLSWDRNVKTCHNVNICSCSWVVFLHFSKFCQQCSNQKNQNFLKIMVILISATVTSRESQRMRKEVRE